MAGIEPPVKVTKVFPFVPLTAPPHVVVAPPQTVIPAGKWSVSGAVKVSTNLLLLLKVRTRDEDPPNEMLAGLKDFPRVGGTGVGVETGVTVKVATAGLALLPESVTREPAATEL